jgi:GMP synthase (glutamine-hydrolysing)
VVAATGKAEYGKAPLVVDDPTDLLTNVESGSTMWMSHGDSVEALPDGFVRLAHTTIRLKRRGDHSGVSMAFSSTPRWCIPPAEWPLIRNFVYHICGCLPDWTTEAFIDEAVADVRRTGGRKARAAGPVWRC